MSLPDSRAARGMAPAVVAKHGPVRCRSNVPGPPSNTMLTITLCLFLAGIAMGAAFACVWAWGVRSGQFRDLEDSKQQVFWPDIAPDPKQPSTPEMTLAKPKGNA